MNYLLKPEFGVLILGVAQVQVSLGDGKYALTIDRLMFRTVEEH